MCVCGGCDGGHGECEQIIEKKKNENAKKVGGLGRGEGVGLGEVRVDVNEEVKFL